MEGKPEFRTVRIPRELQKQIEKIARKHHRSIVGEITHALERYVEEHRQVLDAALAEEAS
jgi:predicted transcriptional regulator